MPLPEAPTSANVLYIGHPACASTNANHWQKAYDGLTFRPLGIICLNVWDSTGFDSLVLIHELGHMYEAPDHYGNGSNGIKTIADLNAEYNTSDFNDTCIYGRKRYTENVINSLTICEGCRKQIQQNSNRFSN